MIKVGLIDDNYFLLNNYKEFLQDFSDIAVVFTCTSLEELSKNIRHGILIKEPDVVLLDIVLPGQAGIDELKKLLTIYPGSKSDSHEQVRGPEVYCTIALIRRQWFPG